ncbi:uncharacterized protein LOC126661066 isoform X1 [Mercurialis annua]|uniref:uncharacterized protein LOC126661066 isoform X1 n=1 Tax=Mercurialis annua TaxID=3986 RepID=UPI00215F18A0|nr:uncharacterized protein LOC126661066 isoform X1 [Mercurialis annua]
MGNPVRTRKRVYADTIRRGNDGSAFQKCDECGVLVVIALADMHACQGDQTNLKIVKRFKGVNGNQKIVGENYRDQPRSGFSIFMEEFRSTCKKGKQIEIDRNGFETWRKMSNKERKPYAIKAEEVNSAYVERLFQEIDYSSEVDDDEADSAIVGKFDPDCLSLHFRYDTFREFESLNTWDMLQPWI